MRAIRLGLLLAVALAVGACAHAPEPPGDWALVWADEFDGDALDPDKWELQRGDGCAQGLCGWGNGELQQYTADAVTVADGALTITARRAVSGGDTTYTSARLRTLGRGDWTYGRFEVRARLPTGRGLWPAIWLLFSDDTYGGWAASGEIDLMEAIGSAPAEVFGTLHYGGPWPDNVYSGAPFRLASGSFADAFHVFALEWEPGAIRWSVDGAVYQTQTADGWHTTGSDAPGAPFDHPFHLILNVAVGGRLPGSPDASTPFPQSMAVDYVRVYERR